MKPTTRKPERNTALRPEQRVDEMLETAIRHFARHGYAEADLQVLADELGIGKGTLYRHFGNKEKLFLAATERVMNKLIEQINAAIAGVADPLERISGAIHAYLEYFAANPQAVEIFIQERALFKDRKRPVYFERREANRAPWWGVYQGLMKQGRVRTMPVERIMDVLGDLLYGAMFTNYIADRRRPPARVAADIIDVMYHGILSDTERHAPANGQSRNEKPRTGNGK